VRLGVGQHVSSTLRRSNKEAAMWKDTLPVNYWMAKVLQWLQGDDPTCERHEYNGINGPFV